MRSIACHWTRTIRTSIARSLERLKVDRVAVLALHDPAIADLGRDDVLRALEDVKQQGPATRIGIAGSLEEFRAAHAAREFVDVAQFAISPGAEVRSLAARGVFAVTHSVFGMKAAGNARASIRYAFGANPRASSLPPAFLPNI